MAPGAHHASSDRDGPRQVPPPGAEPADVWGIGADGGEEPSLTIEPFLGYRLWRVAPAGRYAENPAEPILTSAATTTVWERRDQRAGCRIRLPSRRGRHTLRPHPERPAPVIGCRCGIYAMKTRMRPPRPWMWAHGPVELSGVVYEGTRGYRAERARLLGPLQLIAGTGASPECLKPLCRRPAEWIRVGPTLYLPRCSDHLEPAGTFTNLPLPRFMMLAAEAFAVRYAVAIQEG